MPQIPQEDGAALCGQTFGTLGMCKFVTRTEPYGDRGLDKELGERWTRISIHAGRTFVRMRRRKSLC